MEAGNLCDVVAKRRRDQQDPGGEPPLGPRREIEPDEAGQGMAEDDLVRFIFQLCKRRVAPRPGLGIARCGQDGITDLVS